LSTTVTSGAFLRSAACFFQRLITLKLPNSLFQVSDRSISVLHAPEKTTAPHDVAPEVTSMGHPAKVSLYRNSRIVTDYLDFSSPLQAISTDEIKFFLEQ